MILWFQTYQLAWANCYLKSLTVTVIDLPKMKGYHPQGVTAPYINIQPYCCKTPNLVLTQEVTSFAEWIWSKSLLESIPKQTESWSSQIARMFSLSSTFSLSLKATACVKRWWLETIEKLPNWEDLSTNIIWFWSWGTYFYTAHCEANHYSRCSFNVLKTTLSFFESVEC